MSQDLAILAILAILSQNIKKAKIEVNFSRSYYNTCNLLTVKEVKM